MKRPALGNNKTQGKKNKNKNLKVETKLVAMGQEKKQRIASKEMCLNQG